MRRFYVPLGLLVLFVSSSTGCPEGARGEADGGTETGDVGRSGDTATAAFSKGVERMARLQCERAFDCCSETERRELGVEADAADECGAGSSVGRSLGFGGEFEALRAGEARFDPVMADLCARSLRERSCSEFTGSLDLVEARELRGCSEMLEPLLGEGETCSSDASCKTGFCRSGSHGSLAECAQPPGAGERCIDGSCDSTAWCDRSGREPICRELLARGEACETDRGCVTGACQGARCVEPAPLCDGGDK